jgi:hypothetical protein
MAQHNNGGSLYTLKARKLTSFFNPERTGKLTKVEFGSKYAIGYSLTHGGTDKPADGNLRISFPCIERLSHNLFKGRAR